MSNNITDVSIGKFVSESYARFGHYVNTERSFPYLYDGLKPVYRRIFYACFGLGDKFVKSAQVGGETIGKYHPHGDASTFPVISAMVHYGMFDGQGNHGHKYLTGMKLPPAAPRYSEVRVSGPFRELMGLLMKYVPHEQSDLGFDIPVYLPTPFPLILTFGGQGIGIGSNNRMPAFTMESMYNALLTDNPNELIAPDGLTLDTLNSEMWELWNTGEGRLNYEMFVDWHTSEDGASGAIIRGNPLLFLPDLSKLTPMVEEGLIFIRDESTDTEKRIFVGKNHNVRKVNAQDIHALCTKAALYRKHYSLSVSDGTNIYPIPLKEWLKITYANYLSLITLYKDDNIAKLQYDIQVFTHLPEVAKHIIADPTQTADDIAKKMTISPEVVEGVLSKNIRALMKADTSGKVASLNSKLIDFQSLIETDKVVELIEKFGNK